MYCFHSLWPLSGPPPLTKHTNHYEKNAYTTCSEVTRAWNAWPCCPMWLGSCNAQVIYTNSPGSYHLIPQLPRLKNVSYSMASHCKAPHICRTFSQAKRQANVIKKWKASLLKKLVSAWRHSTNAWLNSYI